MMGNYKLGGFAQYVESTLISSFSFYDHCTYVWAATESRKTCLTDFFFLCRCKPLFLFSYITATSYRCPGLSKRG